MIPRKILNEILADGQESEESTLHVSFESRGPGYLDKWRMRENRKDCWQKSEFKSASNQKRKVIISASYFQNADINWYYNFFEELFAERDVYLWQSKKIDLATSAPITNQAEFWDKSSLIHAAHKSEIIVDLAEQSLPANEFTILDYATLHGAVKKFNTEYSHNIVRNSVRFRAEVSAPKSFNSKDKLEKLSMSKSSIEILNLQNDAIEIGFKKLVNDFPNLKGVNFLSVTNEQIESPTLLASVPANFAVSISMSNNEKQPRKGLILSQIKLQMLTLQLLQHALTIQDAEIENILIGNVTSPQIIFDRADKVNVLMISRCEQLVFMKLPEKLESLSVENCHRLANNFLENVDIKYLFINSCGSLPDKMTLPSGIQWLEVEKTNSTKFTFANPASLIKYQTDFPDVALLNDALALQTIKLKSAKTLNNYSFKHLSNLNSLDINDATNVDFDFSENIKLSTLWLRNIDNLPLLKINSNLKKLFLDNCKNELEINDNEKNSLIELSIRKTKIKNFSSLKFNELQILIIDDLNITEIDLNQFPKLTCLVIKNLMSLKVIGKSTSLQELEIWKIHQLKMQIENYPNLEILDITKTKLDLSFETSGAQLKTLYLYGVEINKLNLEACKNLNKLTLTDVISLSELDLKYCSNLKNLLIFGCLDLSKINNVTATAMESVMIIQNLNANALTIAIDLSRVETIEYFRHTPIAPDNQYKDQVKINRAEISISSFAKTTDIDMSKIGTLHDLTINGDPNELALNPRIKLHTLTVLESGITSLNLRNFPDLMNLGLSNCPALVKIVFLENSPLLALGIAKADSLEKLELQSQKKLTTFIAYHNTKLSTIILNQNPKLAFLAVIKTNGTQYSVINILNSRNIRVAYIRDNTLARLVCVANSVEHLDIGLPQPDKQLQPRYRLSAIEAALNTANQESPVTTYNPETAEDLIDGDTGKTGIHRYHQGINYTLMSKVKVSKDEYRITILDKIVYDGKKIRFITTERDLQPIALQSSIELNEQRIAEQKNFVEADAGYELGYMSGPLKPGHHYALPTTFIPAANDIEFFTSPKNSLDLFWDEKHKQYCVRLKVRGPAQEIKLLYRCKKQFINGFENTLLESHDSLLAENLLKELEKKLNFKDSPVQFIFDTKLSKQERLMKLNHYCRYVFQPTALTKKSGSDLDLLCTSILEARGSCRHRSRAFCVLAQLIGIPAHMVRNSTHQFAEVPFTDNLNKLVYRKYDFGGGDLLELAPPLKNVFAATKTISTPVAKPLVQKSAENRIKFFIQKFEELTKPNKLDSTWELLNHRQILAPLIQLSANDDPFTVNRQILKQIQKAFNFDLEQLKNHLFINSPEEFEHYLRPWRLQNGKYIRELDGPLFHLIKNGGVIVINWTNFTPTQIASYKSILDPKPTILGESVSAQTLVIGLVKPSTQNCSAFRTRTKPWYLTNEFMAPVTPPIAQEIQQLTVEEVDLFKSFAWRELLYGKDKAEGNQTVLLEGPLIRAIRAGTSLVITNPPNDKDFEKMLYRVLEERKFFFNGELLLVKPSTNIKLITKTHKKTLENVKIDSTSALTTREPIYLGLYNFHECYEREKIINSETKPLPSLLSAFNSDKNVFLLTESIPSSEWQRLIATIEKQFPNKEFHFKLAPGVEIVDVSKNIEPLTTAKSDRVFLTNDPDHLTNEFSNSDDKALVIDVNAKTTFADLIFETRIVNETNGTQSYHHIEHDALNALRKGRTVILNGPLSSTLYHQLYPWLSQTGSIHCNGEDVKPTAKLLAVMPMTSEKTTRPFAANKIVFNFEDYQSKFPLTQHHQLEKIQAFYQAALKLPHRGIGRPEQPTLTFQRIKSFINVLNLPHPLHHSNPIKSLFLYDYPKSSEDYAYLNVLGKFYFSGTNQDKINFSKLNALNTQYADLTQAVKNHPWHFLNAFSKSFIEETLGKNLENITYTNFPSLTPTALTLLEEKIRAVLTNPKSGIKNQDTPDKNQFRLKQLLDDPDIFLIMLKGKAGVGKTHAVRKLLGKNNYYEGEAGFKEWLLKGDKPFLFDEANLQKPGFYDFLKGLSRNHKTVYYDGVEYDLSKKPNRNYKIIVTGNPENYPGRYYHQLFQEYAETLYLQIPDDTYLERKILGPLLEKHHLAENRYYQQIFAAVKLIAAYNPYMTITIRDYENLAQRFIYLCDALSAPKNASQVMRALLHACITEFACAVKDIPQRHQFIEDLHKQFNIPYHKPTHANVLVNTAKHKLPATKGYLIEAIEQSFQLRRKFLTTPTNDYYKAGILLEGSPGVGKSTIFEALIEKHLFNELFAHPENEKQIRAEWKYYLLSAGDTNIYPTIKQAFHEGAYLILDEIDLDDETLEARLNQYLTGFDEDGIPAKNPGFMILASKNQSYLEGRKNVSPALRSRLHFMYFDEYTDKELELLATNEIDYGIDFTKAFRQVEAESKGPVNSRTFFVLLNYFMDNQANLPPEFRKASAYKSRAEEVHKHYLEAMQACNGNHMAENKVLNAITFIDGQDILYYLAYHKDKLAKEDIFIKMRDPNTAYGKLASQLKKLGMQANAKEIAELETTIADYSLQLADITARHAQDEDRAREIAKTVIELLNADTDRAQIKKLDTEFDQLHEQMQEYQDILTNLKKSIAHCEQALSILTNTNMFMTDTLSSPKP